MSRSLLLHVARRVSTVLEPRFGEILAQDRAANMLTGVVSSNLNPEEIREGVKVSIEKFREAHCGGFDVSDNEIAELTHDTLVVIFEEIPSLKK